MNIGLISDSKYPNLALMKISAFHKQKGDNVEWYSPLFSNNFDKIYYSKIFSNTKYGYIFNKNITSGGSGINLNSKLPDEIEHIYPDYSLYSLDYAMGFITRGCINNCPFCIVPQKEGKLHRHAELEEFWRDQDKIKLLDNCLTDYKHATKELNKIIQNNLKLDLTQGFNIRTIKPEIAKLLSKIKLWKGKQWHIAWDNINDGKKVLKGIRILNEAGIKNYKIMCYILVGFNTNRKQDLERINTIEKLGVDPFVMCYTKNDYTRALSKWCNRKPIFKSNPDFSEYVKHLQNYVSINKYP